MTIKSYTKRELALMYFPNVDGHTAVNRLTRWISRCKPLREELTRHNYGGRGHSLTPKHVSIIVEYLGEP
ncbi:MAG: DUF4248 domain-containing protein [Prevotellaceae bacterium]|nr:DUF4248 domain-containing protein [Prevotellaceae bacterium]